MRHGDANPLIPGLSLYLTQCESGDAGYLSDVAFGDLALDLKLSRH